MTVAASIGALPRALRDEEDLTRQLAGRSPVCVVSGRGARVLPQLMSVDRVAL